MYIAEAYLYNKMQKWYPSFHQYTISKKEKLSNAFLGVKVFYNFECMKSIFIICTNICLLLFEFILFFGQNIGILICFLSLFVVYYACVKINFERFASNYDYIFFYPSTFFCQNQVTKQFLSTFFSMLKVLRNKFRS